MATVYVTYECYDYDTDKWLQDYELACSSGASLTTSSHAPTISGYTFKSCSPSSISSVSGGETITAYYVSKYVDVEYTCYDDNTGDEIDSGVISDCYVGGSLTVSNYAPTIRNYEFSYSYPSSKLTVQAGASIEYYYLYTGSTNTTFSLSTSGNSIGVTVSRIDERAPYIQITYRPDGGSSVSTEYVHVSGTSRIFTLDNLQYNTTYTVNVRYSPDGESTGTYVGSQSITTGGGTIPSATHSVSGNVITLSFSDLTDFSYINVLYRPVDASSSTSTGYQRLTTSSNKIVLPDLEYGTTYAISYRYSADGTTQVGIVSYGNVTIEAIADSVLIAGAYAVWDSFYRDSSNKWSTNSLSFTVYFGSYRFSNTYFTSVGVSNISIPRPTSTRPETLAYVVANATARSSVTVTIPDLAAGSELSVYFFIKTKTGQYCPIPFGSTSGSYGGVAATMPVEQAYSSGHVPAAGAKVNLLAADINKFIHAVDRTMRWVFDEAGTGIPEVTAGSAISASTYSSLYNALVRIRAKASFSNTFTSVSSGSPIAAANLLYLRDSINNMLGVL